MNGFLAQTGGLAYTVLVAATMRASGIRYVREYLEHHGDLCSLAVAKVVERHGDDADVFVVGPDGVDGARLGELTVGGGGFGVSDDVPQYLRLRIREYLSGAESRAVLFELPASGGSESVTGELFRAFEFAPSLFGSSDGKSWTMWPSGVCGYVTRVDLESETIANVLRESDWGSGIVFFLAISGADRLRLESGAVWDTEMLDGLFGGIEAVLVPAHNREAIVILELGGR